MQKSKELKTIHLKKHKNLEKFLNSAAFRNFKPDPKIKLVKDLKKYLMDEMYKYRVDSLPEYTLSSEQEDSLEKAIKSKKSKKLTTWMI